MILSVAVLYLSFGVMLVALLVVLVVLLTDMWREITTVSELLQYSEDDLLGWGNFGKVTLQAVVAELSRHGLKLRGPSSTQKLRKPWFEFCL